MNTSIGDCNYFPIVWNNESIEHKEYHETLLEGSCYRLLINFILIML